MSSEIVAQLEALVGDESVVAWPEIPVPLKLHLSQLSFSAQPLEAVVFPHTAAEVSEIVSWAARDRHTLVPMGSGSKLGWGGLLPSPLPERGLSSTIAVSTTRLNQVVEHAIGDLTLTAEAGLPLQEVSQLLVPHRQQLGVDPAFPAHSTLGGTIATGDTGSLRQAYGSVRDRLLGVEFVRSDGQVVKAGGRVVKNVAGYDLMKLLTGSYGTLGIITQMTVRLTPTPESSSSVLIVGATAALASVARQIRASSLVPTRFDWVSSRSLSTCIEMSAPPSSASLLLQFQSIAASVSQQVGRTVALAQAAGLTVTSFDAAAEPGLWETVQASLHRRQPTVLENDNRSNPQKIVGCKFGLLPNQAPDLFAALDTLDIPANIQIHASSGIGWICFPDPHPDPQTLLNLRQLCQQNGGYLTILQAPPFLKQQLDIWGYAEVSLGLMRAISKKFDPDAIFAPQRLLPHA